uniref:Uncharacterized protein n=1 Tax=Strigops habroptila TaxID=2489341 RepID=A0A672TUZ6_STRHB
MASIFHQPMLSMHIMSHQNSVFIAFIDQYTNPAKVKSIPVSERLPLCNSTELSRIYFFFLITVLLDCMITEILTFSYSEDIFLICN